MKMSALQKKTEGTGRRLPVARLVSLLLMILTLVSVLYVLVETEPPHSREEPPLPFEGRGTEEEPYRISSVEDAVALSDLVNKGKTFDGIWFRQMTDLDFSAVENWTPIGDLSNGFYTYFYGVYDGAGHTICNIRCDNDYAGYFGLLAGEVRNLGIESGSFTGATVGSIASHGSAEAVIFHCYNKADVFGVHRAGGIADNFSGKILFSWNTGEVTSTYCPAGLVSYSCSLLQEAYCTDLEPVVAATFAGELKNSKKLSEKELQTAAFWNRQYEKRREYDPMLPQSNGAVYMTCENGDIAFADAGFLPEIFREEHDRAAVLAILPDVLLAAVAAVLLCILPFMGRKIRAANEAAAEAARAAAEKAAQKAAEKAALQAETAPQEPAEDAAAPQSGWVRRAAAVCAFLLILAVMLSAVNYVLLPKRHGGIINTQQYQELDAELVDVLILGGSSAAVNLDFPTFWNEYGISFFGLGSETQPMWNSYYQLLEGLKRGKPEVVVLDVKGVAFLYEYGTEATQTAALLGVPYSMDRIKAVRSAVEQGEWMDYILGFPKYHSRFSTLMAADFSKEYGAFDWGNFSIAVSSGNVPLTDVSSVTAEEELPYKAEFYLRKIIECCQENDIELLLIKTPDTQISITQPLYNRVQTIADEYDVPFINYNLMYDEVGFLSTDFSDDSYHISVSGARKHALHLGAYLQEHYRLEDHRGDPAYSGWETFAVQRQNAFLSLTPDRDVYLSELGRGDYEVFLIEYKSPVQDENYQAVINGLQAAGIDPESCRVTGEAFQWNGSHYTVKIQNGTTTVYVEEYGQNVAVGSISDQGILCIVCDNKTGEIVDASALIQSNGFAPVHLQNAMQADLQAQEQAKQ